jgi:hypothetical protein
MAARSLPRRSDLDRMVPLLSAITADLGRAFRRAHETLGLLTGMRHADDPRRLRLEARFASHLGRVREHVREVEALGALVRDYERGWIDVLGEVDGRVAYLSWARGEPAFDTWHGTEEPFASRRPIARPAAAA